MGFYSFTQLLIDLRRAIQIRGHVLRERVLVRLLGLVVAIEDEVALAFDVLGPERRDAGPESGPDVLRAARATCLHPTP